MSLLKDFVSFITGGGRRKSGPSFKAYAPYGFNPTQQQQAAIVADPAISTVAESGQPLKPAPVIPSAPSRPQGSPQPQRPPAPQPAPAPVPAPQPQPAPEPFAMSNEDLVKSFVSEESKQKAELERVLNDLYREYGVADPYSAAAFDEAVARAEAERQINPYFTQKADRLKGRYELEERDVKEDYGRTAAEVGARRRDTSFNSDIRRRALENTLANQGTYRSGVGIRQRGLEEIGTLNTFDDLTREDTNNEQVLNLNKEKIGKAREYGLGEIEQERTQNVANDVQFRKGAFNENELNRYQKYQKSREDAMTAALSRVYGRA